MSAPVDVLAVMDWAADQVIARAACASDANRFNTAQQLREARAAIAALIEKANACALSLTPADDSHNDGLYVVRACYVHELRAALAAVSPK